MTQPARAWGSYPISESFWRLLHPTLRDVTLPQVPRVDCGQCRRASEGTARWDVRCCDVTPQLPNFLIGELLTHRDHPVILDWIEQRRGDPYFLLVPPVVAKRHLDARQDGLYGLRCPLLSIGEGRCSMYHTRPALCIGYHCYYPDRLWQEAWACLTSLLDLYQHAAARFLVASADLDLLAIAALWQEIDEASLWDGEQQRAEPYRAMWQQWRGRERGFYEDCFHRLCQEPDRVRRQMASLHRRQLMARLDATGLLTTAQEQALGAEDDAFGGSESESAGKAPDHGFDQLTPALPPPSLRRRLWQGAIPAAENPHSIRQVEQFLLWWLQQLKEPSLWASIWHWLRPREIAEDEAMAQTCPSLGAEPDKETSGT